MSFTLYTKDLYHKIPPADVPRLSGATDKPFSYVPMSNVILRCDTAYLKDTDETIPITPDFKLVYTYMRDRYAFSRSKGQPYYESWDSIASIIGKSGAVFKSKNDRGLPINKLMERVGLLVILDKKTCRANHKQVNDVYDVLDKVVFLNSKDADYKERKRKEREEYLKRKEGLDKKEEVRVSSVIAQEPLNHEMYPEVDPFSLDALLEGEVPF